MKKAKKILALLLAFCMILSTNVALGYAIESNIFAGVSQDEANMTVTLTSVIYKDDGTGNYVPVTTVNPGDEVVARVSVYVSEPTVGMEMVVVWDADAFDDRLESAADSDLTLNSELQFSGAAGKYDAYDCGNDLWDRLATGINGEDEDGNEFTYITEAMHDKYENSWAYININLNGAKTVDGSKWLFEIPLTVKTDADLANYNPAFGVVEDAFVALGIGDYDWDGVALAGITDANFEDFNARIPYMTTNDATVTVEEAIQDVIVMFDKGANDATITGDTIFEGAPGTSVAVPAVSSNSGSYSRLRNNLHCSVGSQHPHPHNQLLQREHHRCPCSRLCKCERGICRCL